MLEQQTFGSWLRRKRKALDLTREGLADRVGCSIATIRKIEAEERRPSAQIAERLADVLDISQDERTAFLRFARGDWRVAPGETKEGSPWQSPTNAPRSNVPATTTSLVGREQEIGEILDYVLIPNVRLITLMGSPGIGKTRLSIEVAHDAVDHFPDGVFFVALAPLDDPNLIGITIAQALGYVSTRNISTSKQLKEGIGDKRMLIILDNCEHLIDDVASLAASLLSACSHLKILATSRESLRIAGEWLYPVPTFGLPTESSSITIEDTSHFPALTLFAERARAVRPDFKLDRENIRTVSAICAHLDCLPLAIELIAARMRLMSPQALLTRRNDQFILSADGMRAPSLRQKTLNNAIGWSYELLSEEEKTLFAYCSIFSGTFTLEAVERIFSKSVEKSVSDLMTSLFDKSLLQRSFDEHGEPIFTMLVTIKKFARERLRDRGEEAEMCNLHLAYFLDLAIKADKELRGHNQLYWLQRLDFTRDNLRAALDWTIETGQTEMALKLARKLHWFWFVRGDHNEGIQSLTRVLERPDALFYPGAQAEALTQIAHHVFLQVHHSGLRVEENSVMPLAERALSIARAHTDKHNTARSLAMLGLALTYGENFALAQSALEESQALYREVKDEWGYAHALMCLAWGFFRQGNLDAYLTLNGQALAVFKKLGDRYFTCVTLRGMAAAYLKQNDLTRAMAGLREALLAAQELKSKYEIAVTLAWCGQAEKQLEHSMRSVCLFWAYRSILDSIGVWSERDEDEFENDLAPSRAGLGESEFAQAMEQGRAMTMEQAIAYALEDQSA